MKIIFFFLIGLIIFVSVIVVIHIIQNKPTEYQGPVRPTDDEAYFRKTGITKPLGSLR